MIERDKQKTDQAEKLARQQQHEQQKKQPNAKSQQKEARSDTDSAAANDKQYVERIEEKTEKHWSSDEAG